MCKEARWKRKPNSREIAMRVFSKDSRGTEIWGPTASVDVRIDALSSVVGNSWLLVDLAIGAKEIVDIRQCFSDVSYIYALGNNQAESAMTLKFVVLVGRKDCKGKDNFSAISDGFAEYADNRVSMQLDPMAITIGKFSRMGWMTSLNVGALDASKGICYGTAEFIVELKGASGGGKDKGGIFGPPVDFGPPVSF